MDAKPMINALNKCSAKQLGTKAHLLSPIARLCGRVFL